MDNLGELGELLRPLLDDPDTMDKLRQEAEKLGLGDMMPPGDQADGIKHAEQPGGAGAEFPSGPDGKAAPGSAAEMGAMLSRIAPLLSGMSREDDSTRLLAALRPFLSEKRGRRLDEAGKILMIMRVIRMLPKSDG